MPIPPLPAHSIMALVRRTKGVIGEGLSVIALRAQCYEIWYLARTLKCTRDVCIIQMLTTETFVSVVLLRVMNEAEGIILSLC